MLSPIRSAPYVASSPSSSPVPVNGPVAATLPSSRLPIPQSGTVLTLTGANFNVNDYVDDQFGGKFKRAPYERVKVEYPASLGPRSIDRGVAELDRMLKSTPGPKIVLAHSQGAQVASRWMREHANDPDAPGPDELTFILTGNPARAGSGAVLTQTMGKHTREADGSPARPTPLDTPWSIVDVARRYDGFADSVQDRGNSAAARNAMLGKLLIHPHYENVDLDDPGNTIWQDGNTSFVLTDDAAPLLERRSMAPWREWLTSRYIESAHLRPGGAVAPRAPQPTRLERVLDAFASARRSGE